MMLKSVELGNSRLDLLVVLADKLQENGLYPFGIYMSQSGEGTSRAVWHYLHELENAGIESPKIEYI